MMSGPPRSKQVPSRDESRGSVTPPTSSLDESSFSQDSEATPVINSPVPSDHSPEVPIEANVFYNEETLKYMRIIDMYKKLGIGKDIELPRVLGPPDILFDIF
jgi:hypothetical protein